MWALVGSSGSAKGTGTGEKELKSLIGKLPEWQDNHARLQLVRSAVPAGQAGALVCAAGCNLQTLDNVGRPRVHPGSRFPPAFHTQAAECESSGASHLADVLRAKAMPCLRKADLYHLARAWRLRSSIWRPGLGRKAAARRSPAPAKHPQPLTTSENQRGGHGRPATAPVSPPGGASGPSSAGTTSGCPAPSIVAPGVMARLRPTIDVRLENVSG